MKLAEVAARINAHLKRFQYDPTINVRPKGGILPYYFPGADAGTRYVRIWYVTFQGEAAKLTRAEAEAYLAWLDRGGVGTWSACVAAS